MPSESRNQFMWHGTPYDYYKVNTDASHRAYFGCAAFGGLIGYVQWKFVKLYIER